MQLLANAKQQFIDQNGLPLASGTVGFYYPGTLNPKPTYEDPAGTIANTNPVQLDSRGQALIWGSGVYRQILKDASGVTIWDQITEDANAGLTGNITNARWIAGASYTDPVGLTPGTFVPGTTTTLNLPVQPGAITNIWPYFDGGFQQDDQISSLNGSTLIFTSAVPVGVQAVEVKIGTTIAIGTPGAGTVTDASIALGTKLYNRLNDFIDLRDRGCKCDGVTDDTVALQIAATSIGSTGATLIIPGPTLFSGNITFGSNTVLWPLNGGYLIGKAGTEVVTIQQTPFAGPVPLLKNCQPVATKGMNLLIEWFGAVADGATDCGAAFNAAYASLKTVGGQIKMQPGTYLTNSTIVNNGSHIHLIGSGQNSTLISMTSATLDGIQNFGIAGTPLANCSFREFGLVCSAAGSSTGSFGLNLQYNAFTLVENIQVQEFLFGINLLRATNTQLVQAGASYVNGTTNGATCFNFNGGGTGTGGNASTTLRNCFAVGNNALTGSIGYKLTGTYMSDLFFDACETGGTNYGYYFDYNGANFYEDVLINRPIVDQFTAQGIFIQNMPAGGKLTISGGWINPKAAAPSVQDIYVLNSQGLVSVNGAQIVADANVANTEGIRIENTSGVNVVGCQISETNVGIHSISATACVYSGNIFNNSITAASFYISGTGDARTMVTGNSFKGRATVGVGFDTTSSSCGVVGNTFVVTNIGTRVSNFSTAGGGVPVGGTDGSTGLNSGF